MDLGVSRGWSGISSTMHTEPHILRSPPQCVNTDLMATTQPRAACLAHLDHMPLVVILANLPPSRAAE